MQTIVLYFLCKRLRFFYAGLIAGSDTMLKNNLSQTFRKPMRYIILTTFFAFLSVTSLTAQSKELIFAHLTDNHIGKGKAEEAALNSVKDINNNPMIRFLLVTGDLTNNGSEEHLHKAKEILDKLTKKYYVIPENHEDVWSSSGGTLFTKVFGKDRFDFEDSGFFFLGTDCEPMLRHGLVHIQKDNLAWMDSVLNRLREKTCP